MDVVSTEIAAIIESVLDVQLREVLVPKSHHFLLRDEESELVFALFGKLGELDILDLGTNVCGQVGYFGTFEQIWEGWIRVLSVVVVLKWYKRVIVCYSQQSARVSCQSQAHPLRFSLSQTGR